MMNSIHSTANRLLAIGTILCLIPSLAMAQPAGGKGENARGNGERRSSNGAVGSPDEMAVRMISDHDRNQDAELSVRELTTAVAAPKQQRGRQQSGRAGRKRMGGRQQNDAGKGRRDAQKGGKQQRRGRERQQGVGGGRNQGGDQQGQRGSAGRAMNPAQIATKLIADFDKNRSGGLDVNELTASIKAQRQGRSGKGGAEARGVDGKTEGENSARRKRPRGGDSSKAGEGKKTDQEPNQSRQKRGKERADKDNSEPGAGVVPKRPGE